MQNYTICCEKENGLENLENFKAPDLKLIKNKTSFQLFLECYLTSYQIV
jgi:hypothetical protein